MREKGESEGKKEEYPEIVLFCVVSQRPRTTSWPPCPDPLTSAIGKAKQSSGLRLSDSRLILHPQNPPQKGTVAHPSYSLELVVFAKVILKFRVCSNP